MIVTRDNMKSQSHFFREGLHRLLRWLFVELVIILILMVVILYIILSQHAPPYYVTTIDGRLMLITPS